MKKNQLCSATVFIAFVVTMLSCAKNEECKTCTAKNAYDNSIVKTEKVCNDDAEADFKFRYNSYPTIVTCE